MNRSDPRFIPGTSGFTWAKSGKTTIGLWALVIGLFVSVILGAANAYLGLKVGMTTAAVYPAAVVGMALLCRVMVRDSEPGFRENVAAVIKLRRSPDGPFYRLPGQGRILPEMR